MVREAAGVTGVLHCFAGGRRAFRGRRRGGLVHLVFRPHHVPQLRDPGPGSGHAADRLLIETDAPYLAPVPHRGRRNEPAYVVEVARRAAELRGEAMDHVAARTAANARAFYGLATPAAETG
jgi:TatD DNase family protein